MLSNVIIKKCRAVLGPISVHVIGTLLKLLSFSVRNHPFTYRPLKVSIRKKNNNLHILRENEAKENYSPP